MTMAGRRGTLARKLARLDALLAEEGIAPAARSLPRRPAGTPAPLSVGEEQLWFLQRLAPEDPAYNMSFRFSLRGRLDAAALRAAAGALVSRHEALRTAYPAVSGRPEKIEVPVPPPAVLDLSALPAALREGEAARIEREEAARPFDLQGGPVLRMLLLALEEREHRLLLCVHHIAADGASVGLIVRELAALYRDLLRGLPPSLPEPAAQLGDFAAWQREWLCGEEAAAQRSWWSERLRGYAPLELPADRPAPAVTTSRGAYLPIAFDAGMVRGLRAVGQAERATLFMVALAALQALLGRICDREDVAVGSPVSGRSHPELEGAVGFFVNMVVLRTDLGGDPAFRELVDRVRDGALEAFSRGGLPFETLVEELSPERGGRRNPLFEVALVVEAPSAPPAGEGEGDDLAWELSDIPNGTAKFDLELELQEKADGLTGRIWYARDRFDAPAIERLAGHFRELLAAALSDPGQRLSALPVLTAAERQELLVDWADTGRPYPADRGIPELFAEHAAAHPERTALVFAGEPVSYGELSRRAERIAAHLRAQRVGPEDRVGLFAERSPELIAAHLGVLAAGAAYVPLDARYPRERLEWMLEDAGLAAILVQRRLAGSLPSSAPRPIVLEDVLADVLEDSGPLDGQRTGPDSWAGPDSAAYVMYTSGSTGRPKGVVVSHRNVVRLVRETDFARLDAGEVFLQLAPVAFDAATLEIWGPLLNGGTLVVADPHALSLDELGEVVEREGVTTLWLTAGLFHRMVDEQLSRLAGVRQLLAGGDVLSPAHVERVLESLPGCRLINGYGPTENTTFTCCHTVRERPEGPVPIGRPIANTWVHVLDRGLRPVPVGVPGELCAGGEGLARGYLGRPALTAERFVPDPVSTVPGARLYRTGDLVRRRPDGTVDFLGRLDHQVKIRGFRVEPGEVEAMLGLHPGVASCAVVVRADPQGDKRLVAYVVAAGEPAPPVTELRAYLERELPAPMVPSVFVQLDALPLSPNGKVDRRALPEPGESAEAAHAAAPRTPLEELTAGIWAEVLGRERIGVDEDFFALGGHSLTLMQVASRLRGTLGIDLPLRILFEAPTVAALAERLERERRPALELPPLRRFPREGATPLSFAQRRLWFLDQLEPGPAYNVPLALELRGALDARALEAALGAVVARHESLRTAFPARGGEPVQAIADPPQISLPCVDLESLPPPVRAAEAARLASVEARAPFDLAQGPVLRALLVRQGAEEHKLLLVLHHIASDGWSMRVLLTEMEELYAAAREKRPALLPELPVQYADFALWQRAWLTGQELERQLAWWRPRLAGVPVLELPADRPYPPVRTAQGGERSRPLPAGLAAGLRALARREGVTLFMVLLAGVRALLYRTTGQSDFAVGTPVANRQRAELEGLIGFFANTLVLRSQVSGRAPFRQLLATAREDVLGAHDHQDVPFESLVEDLQPERDLGRTPLFQVLLVLENESAPPRLPGLAATVRTLETGTAKLDLGFFFSEREGATVAGVDFSTVLFDAGTAERMLDHWLTLLAGAAADPGAAVARLPMLGAAERQQILLDWNDTRHTPGGAATIHSLCEEQAARTPEAEAIAWRDQTLTYAALDRRANQLARRLRRSGVEPETRVAVLLPRSLDLVVSLLAILKAGGSYVPLDPAYPVRRLEMMLEDAGASILLTESGLASTLSSGPFTVLRLDEERASLDAESGARPEVAVEPDNLGYLIYTSGSTGRPKAVAITHRSAVALLRWAHGVYEPETLTGVLAATSVCFDLSVFELFVPLAWGGRILLVDDALALASLPDADRVTLVNSVPSALSELVRLGALPPSVRVVNLAGEALHNSLVQAIYQQGVERVYNLYGPSEDTTYSTFRLKQKGAGRVPTIGWPLTGTRAYVLDADGEPVPVGVAGELFLGGEGLARGYLGRPELTAEKFVPDAFAPEPGGRLYRTGDLVRRLPDGNLFFLGRIDHQVKVRGFRIELGEIEAALCAHPAVRQAVVTVRQGDDPALVAYAAPASEVPAPAELRRWLRERLPEHMLPSAFVRLEALPLGPNGKVDRKALPALVPDAASRPEGGGSAVPRTPHEEILAAVWAEVLGLEAVGAQDDFFALGGHSLKATQVVARLRESLKVDLPVRAVFETPTIAGLAARVERALRERQAGAMAELPPLVPVPRDRRPPLSYAQQRLWFLDRLQPGNLAYSVPAFLDWDGPLRPEILERALIALAARHEPLRTTFTVEEGEPVQVIAPRPSLTLPQVDLTALPAGAARGEAERRIAEVARLPFDLESGPLLRLVLLRLPDLDRLLTVFHHVVADWWSLGIFLRELAELYGAFAAGAADPLAPLPVQYADYAAWQREWLRGERLESQLAEWRRQLADIPPLELPADRPRPVVRTFRGASHDLALPPSLGSGLTTLARREGGITRFMAILAGFQLLLHRWTGQESFAVGSPVANRTHPGVEGMIGFFVNTLALRADLAGEPSFAGLLRRVRETSLAAWAHQDVPFERLVEELAPRRELSQSPLFQVSLTFQNELPRWEGAGLDLAFEGVPLDTAKFDLTLGVGEGRDGLAGYLEVNADLFDGATAERLIGGFQRLLAAAVADPERPVGELPLLDEAERRQVLSEWNDTRAEAPSLCVHERFAAHAARRPEAPALVCEDTRWTYGELHARASALARQLRNMGVGPEVRVGLCLERSAETVVSLLAVLQAGGAYVPLDPAYPRERLSRLVQEAGVEALVTLEPLRPRLPETGVPVVCLDGLPRLREGDLPSGGPSAGLDHLAYVLFTSGSTGQPKAVAIGHRQLAGYVDGVSARIGLPEGSSWATVSTFSADLGNTAIFPALCTGGCLHVISERRVTDPVLFAEYFRRERVDCLKIVPSHLAALRTGPDPAGVLPARRLVLGGEASSWEMVAGLRALAPDLGILNHYGPTETTVGVLTWEVEERVERAATVPLGRPLPHVRTYVLDRRLEPLPPGVPGELCIGGESLARGYLGRPDLTAERFVPDPHAGPGARLYRTGDRARRLPGGAIEFLGRIDHQVKIRGFRVEPGEIEAALERCAGVRAAVVLAREGADGSRELAAWVAGDRSLEAAGLREALRTELPPHMIPSAFVVLDALPLTANGKVDRRALPAPEAAAPAAASLPEPPASGLAARIAEVWRDVLGVERVGLRDNFFDLGGHSLLLIRVQGRLRQDLGLQIPVVDLFRFPTVAALADRLGGEATDSGPAVETSPQATPDGRCDVAVIGLSGRFPGARSAAELWDNLCRGVEAITFFGETEEGPGGRHVPARGILADADLFDAGFFGIRPREAELIDPQHRLFLECAWEALESAGQDPARTSVPIGVWAGVGKGWYYLSQIHGGPGAGEPEAHFGNDKDFLPTRVSYKLGLRGPSLAVQTSCSSSLVAVHLACRSLMAEECGMALAGGVRIVVPQESGYVYEEGGIASPDGHCRAFDADARGVVPGNGVGVVLLKRLSDALADGDPVLAVIRGSAINNDGFDKVGYTAPSVDGQARVIAAAHAAAGVTPGEITYVEAHGTGTALGDPIEVAALKQAFAGVEERGACVLGSIKTNVGHLDAAAGVTGLIKAVLALQHRQIPATLHFQRPNPELGIEESPFFVSAALLPWEAQGTRRAGVSSFGIGGTNAHVVLEEAPSAEPSGPSRPWQLLTVSARSTATLARAAANLADHLESHLESHVEGDLADTAWTLHVGRRAFPHRLSVVADGAAGAAAALRQAAAGATKPVAPVVLATSVAFLFPGQGTQRAGMARDLYREEPVFRAEIDRAADLLRERFGLALREVLDPPAGMEEEAGLRLEQTELTQPALFAVEHALARLWMSWGIRPAALLGHSVGEYVAACLAGVFSFEDALTLVAERGRLMSGLPAGGMLAVPLSEAAVRARLADGLSLAAVNGAMACVVAGETDAVEAFRERLLGEGVEAKRLRVSHAFHSAMMDPVLDRFAAAVARVERRPPSLPWVSNVSGTWIRPEEATDPAYWARHLREAVRFHDGLGTLLADPGRLLLEVGPGESLGRFARRHPDLAGRPVLGGVDQRAVLEALGRLWAAGIEPDWTAFHAGERRRRVALPTYPFERQRYWAEPQAPDPAADVLAAATANRGAAAVLLAVPPGSSPTVPAGWAAHPLESPLSPDLAAAFGQTLPPGGTFVLLRPAPTEAIVAPVTLQGGDAPRDEIETTLTAIWREAFGIAHIGIHDGFFHLGGDSLLATQIVSRVRAAVGREIPLSAFLEAGTIARLADLCRSAPASPSAADVERLIADLESLSTEELEALLATQSPENKMNDRGLQG